MRVQFLLKNTGMVERLGIMTLSSVLKKQSHQVELSLTEEVTEEKIVEQVKTFKPQVLAYSIMTGEHIYHIDLNQINLPHKELARFLSLTYRYGMSVCHVGLPIGRLWPRPELQTEARSGVPKMRGSMR